MHHKSVVSFLATFGPLVFLSQMPDNVGDLLIVAGATDLVDSLGTEYRTIRIGEVPDQPVTNETEAGNVNLFDLPFASKIIFKQGARRGPPPKRAVLFGPWPQRPASSSSTPRAISSAKTDR